MDAVRWLSAESFPDAYVRILTFELGSQTKPPANKGA